MKSSLYIYCVVVKHQYNKRYNMETFKAVYELDQYECIASEIRQDITAKNEAEAESFAKRNATDWSNELGYSIKFVGIEKQ